MCLWNKINLTNWVVVCEVLLKSGYINPVRHVARANEFNIVAPVDFWSSRWTFIHVNFLRFRILS
jgi:hypothetical protein